MISEQSLNENLKKFISIKPEVQEAITSGHPVVALESTIISHGMPYPQNIETALEVESIIRKENVIPATIALIQGKIRIGLDSQDFEVLGNRKASESVHKVSRRDLSYMIAKGLSGGTTVAATLICAQLVGLPIFATGGIGGVHREGEKTFDISSDLQELGRTNIAVVCAGAKSILDIGLTLEVLETLGVPVIGYQTTRFPSFYSRESAFSVDYRMDELTEIANLIRVQKSVGIQSGILIANPIPKEDEIPNEIVDRFIQHGLKEAAVKGIRGKETTPFLLSFLARESEGKTLKANISLIKNNALIAARLAKEL